MDLHKARPWKWKWGGLGQQQRPTHAGLPAIADESLQLPQKTISKEWSRHTLET
jgi:hypothetical protein